MFKLHIDTLLGHYLSFKGLQEKLILRAAKSRTPIIVGSVYKWLQATEAARVAESQSLR